MVLATLLQSLYGIVDMVITGQYCGSAGLSGVSVGSNLMTMFSMIAVGLSTGGNIVIGQYFGARDEKNRQEATATTVAFLVITGIGIAAILFVLAKPILLLMQAPAMEEAMVYFRICAVGCIFIYGYNALCAVIRAVGNSKTPLYIILAAALVNVGLDLLLIGVFRIGVAGAAIATVSSQLISFLIALLYVLRKPELFGFRLNAVRISAEKLKLILKVGIPNALVFCINGITHSVNFSLVNTYGVAASAGCGSALKVIDICIGFVTTNQNASATMVAQCIGAGKYERVRQTFRACLLVGLAMSLILMAVMFFGARQLIGLFNGEPEVLELGAAYLRIIALQAFTYIFFTSLNSVASGAGDAKIVMLNCILCMALPRILLAVTLNHLIGLNGMAWSNVLAPLVAIPIGLWYLLSEKYKHQLIRES